MELTSIDLASLTALAGGGVVSTILRHMAEDGYTDVKPSHGYVIQRLVDEEPTIGALAESLGMTQQGASKQVKDLQRLGYVEQIAVPHDQRARKVRLTAAGHGVLESGRRARARIEAEVEEQVGREALAAAKLALAALLGIVGLDDRVRSRTVPAPPE
jgi:DNA-binding MarR family transcriptional regulator